MPVSAERRRYLLALAAASALLGVAIGALVMMPPLEPGVPVTGAVAQALGGRPVYAFSFPETPTAALERPISVAVSGDSVYVVDSEAGVVRVFDVRGNDRSTIGSGTLEVPVYVARDASRGLLYVSDRESRRLLAFADDGTPVGPVWPRAIGATGSTEPTAWAPLGLDVADDGLIYVTDVSARHRVLVLEPDGTIVREVGGARAARYGTGVSVVLDYPNAVHVGAGEIWVSDSNNQRVVVFGTDGQFRRVVPMSGLARGLDFIASAENTATMVAVVDALSQDISVVDATGTVLGTFGQPGSSAGRLAFPNDIAVSSDGTRLFIADTGNRRIQVWDIVADESEIAGLPAIGPADARRRLPFIAVAVLGFALALLTAVVTVSRWRRERASRA